MRCWQGKPEVNAGKSFGRVNVEAMGCISDPKVTHSLLTVLILILVAVMFVLLYVNRRKVQENVKPLIDNFQLMTFQSCFCICNPKSAEIADEDLRVELGKDTQDQQ